VLSLAKNNPITGIRGRGGYFTDWGKSMLSNFMQPPSANDSDINKLARGGMEMLAGAVPEIAPFASLFGNAGSMLSRAIGLGSYSVSRNSLMPPGGAPVEGMPAVARPPAFGSVGKGSDIVFSHAEFVADVPSSIAFTTTKFVINAGNPILFPWMSQLGILYEEYEFDGLLFEFRPTSATAVGTTTSGMGVVLIATEYDAYDAGFTSKRAMEAAEFSSSAVPYDHFLHPIECDPKKNVLATNFVVPGITEVSAAPGDARMSILGVTTVATEGQQTDGDIIGELWVTYHVRLSRPVLESTSSTNTVFTQHVWGTTAALGTSPGIVGSDTFGGTGFNVILNGETGLYIGCNVTNSGNGNIGRYLIQVICTDGSAGVWQAVDTTISVSGGVHIVNLFMSPPGTQPATIGAASVASSSYNSVDNAIMSVIVEFTDATGSVDIPMIVSTNALAFDIIISPISGLVTSKFPTPPTASEVNLERRLREVEGLLKNLSTKDGYQLIDSIPGSACISKPPNYKFKNIIQQ
jgi:hypothetical protein